MIKSSYIIFTDFDGTITLKDVGDKLFQHFGDSEIVQNIFKQYVLGNISETECWNECCKTIESINTESFKDFVLEQKIDEHFHNFNSYCVENKIPINILSGGFNQYIKIILDREKLNIPFYANNLNFLQTNKVYPSFDFTTENCENCANCKRNHIISKSSEDQIIIYIGNGHSDRCPSKFADIVFAKGSLIKYCEADNVTYHRFENFGDVLSKFKLIIENDKPKKRKSAELLRKEIIMME